jgi:hypothetical protein
MSEKKVATTTGAEEFLQECIDLMRRKSRDYQNPSSSVRQIDYYPSGIMTIIDIIQGKILRMRSVAEAMRSDPDYNPNFESLRDSCMDMVNYASFAAAMLNGKLDGQRDDRDIFNRYVGK